MDSIDPEVRMILGGCCALAAPFVAWPGIARGLWWAVAGVGLAGFGCVLAASALDVRGGRATVAAAVASFAISAFLLWIASQDVGRIGAMH